MYSDDGNDNKIGRSDRVDRDRDHSSMVLLMLVCSYDIFFIHPL